MRGITSSSLAIFLLVLLPTIALAILGIRALDHETSLRQLEISNQQDLQLKLIDKDLNAGLEQALLTLHDFVESLSNSRRAIREMVMSDDGFDLVVIYDHSGEMVFPPEMIQALPREQSLMNQYAGVLNTQFEQLSEAHPWSTLPLGVSAGMRLLHCWHKKRSYCVLISKDWIVQQLNTLLPLSQSNNHFPVKLHSDILPTQSFNLYQYWPLSATLTGWHLQYQPLQEGRVQHLQPAYAAIFFPIIVLLIGLGAWLYSIQKRFLKENQRKTTFLRLVAHEFKTPLANLRLYSSLVRRSDSHQETLGYMDVFDAEFFRMRRFLNNATYFEHPDLNVTSTLEVLDLEPFLKQLVQPFLPRLANSKIDLSIICCRCDKIQVARDALECAVVNLIDNIIKYAPGKPAEINCFRADCKLVVLVKDGGTGISRSYQNHLFCYNQHVGVRYDGFGLGLVVTKQLIENADGTISYTNEKGSTFEIKLPLQEC